MELHRQNYFIWNLKLLGIFKLATTLVLYSEIEYTEQQFNEIAHLTADFM